MPNAGIQAWRSTNWKSAPSRVEPPPQQQRRGEHQQRHGRARACGPRRARARAVAAAGSSRSRAPTSGRNTMTEAASESVMRDDVHVSDRRADPASSPQVVAEDQHDAEEQRRRRRRGPTRSAAGAAPLLPACTDVADAVDRAVDRRRRRRPSTALLENELIGWTMAAS